MQLTANLSSSLILFFLSPPSVFTLFVLRSTLPYFFFPALYLLSVPSSLCLSLTSHAVNNEGRQVVLHTGLIHMVHCVSDSCRTRTDAQTWTALTGFRSRPSAGCIYISCRLRETRIKKKKKKYSDAASFSHQASFIMQHHKLLQNFAIWNIFWFCFVQSQATLSQKSLLHENLNEEGPWLFAPYKI